MTTNKEVIKIIKDLHPKGRIRGVVMNEGIKYNLYVMESYSGGKGVGVMGSATILTITFKTKESAEKLKNLINRTFK